LSEKWDFLYGIKVFKGENVPSFIGDKPEVCASSVSID